MHHAKDSPRNVGKVVRPCIRLPADVFLVAVRLLILKFLDQFVGHFVVSGRHFGLHLPADSQAELSETLVLFIFVVEE